MRGLHASYGTTKACCQATKPPPAALQPQPKRDLSADTSFFNPKRAALASIGAAASLLLSAAVHAAPPPPDVGKVGTCLLQNCQTAVLGCVEDANCLKDLICLNNCNGAPDVTACQIRCGDLYEDKAVGAFNACAISQKQCVPTRVDEGVFPVPPDCALDSNFKLSSFTGRWYITAGLNPLFDIFDCQVHYFDVPAPGKLTGQINWRIKKPYGDFLERKTIQSFVQQENPALLLNRGNEYLHYEDDWYILASKPNEYVLVYYRGNNDAWKGYGGAVLYTRASSLPEKYVPELRAAAEAAGIDWSKMVLTNNSCPKHPTTALQRLDKDVKALDERFEGNLKSFGKGFTVLEGEILSEIKREEAKLEKGIVTVEQALEKFETGVEKELLEEAAVVRQEVENDGRVRTLAALLVPVVGWVLFNISGPGMRQLQDMQQDQKDQPPQTRRTPPPPAKRKVGSKSR